jgi:GT2 family glycosyltransferase
MGKGEDSEISLRFFARGEKLMYVPDAVIYHRVQKEKLNKKSFQSYYFNYGRFRAKIGREEFSHTNIICFGVPRYMIRILIRKALEWFFTFNPDYRLCNKLKCYEYFGRIAEYFH